MDNNLNEEIEEVALLSQINLIMKKCEETNKILVNTMKILKSYVNQLKNDFKIDTTGNLEKQIKNRKEILTSLLKLPYQRNEVHSSISELIRITSDLHIDSINISKKLDEEYINIMKLNETLTKELMKLIEEKKKEDLEKIKEEYESEKKKLELYISNENEFKKKLENRRIIENEGILNEEEIKQIEIWCVYQMGEIVFDSNKNNWKKNTSEFDSKIMNRRKILIIIETDNNNKFGAFIHSPINIIDEWIEDKNAFIFSIKNINGEKKISNHTIKEERYGIIVHPKEENMLFMIGSGGQIIIRKEDSEYPSTCNQNDSFEFEDKEDFLCDGFEFKLKRLIVIQMN